jgi:cholecystokinin A receptor
MANEWIHRHNEILTANTTFPTTLERIGIGITSRSIMDVTSAKNITQIVMSVHKSVKSTPSAPSWTDSGTWIIFLYSVIFLLAVIGNLLVILTLIQSRRMRTITNLFLLNLAVSDLFLGVFCMPFTLVGTLLRDFIFGELMCKLLPYLQGAFKILI